MAADPILVEAPDGTVVEFPAGTDRETMRRAMASRFTPEPAAPPARFGQVEVSPEGRTRMSVLPGVNIEMGGPGGRFESPAVTRGDARTLQETLGRRGTEDPFAEAAGAAVRIGGGAGRDIIAGVAGLAEDAVQLTPGGLLAQRMGAEPLDIAGGIPPVERTPGEQAASAAIQFGLPGGYGAHGAERLTRSAVQSLPRGVARASARVTAMAVGAFATDAAVTDPENAVTFGDLFGDDFPTAIREEDSTWMRRMKVGFEGMLLTGAVAPVVEGVARGIGAVRAISSLQENANRQVRESFVDALRRGQTQVTETPVDDARNALRELIDAQRTYREQGLDAVPEHMRPFVANDIQITPGEYLAARKINVASIEVYRQRALDPRVLQRTQETTDRLRQATERATGDVGVSTDPLRGQAERIAASAEAQTATARSQFAESAQELYESVGAEVARQRQSADQIAEEVSQQLRAARDARADGNIDAAVRAERRAAMTIRDSLYGAIDPNGTVPVSPRVLREELDAFNAAGGAEALEEVPGLRLLERRVAELASRESISFKDVQQVQRLFSRVGDTIASNRDYGVYAEAFQSFRQNVFARYADEIAREAPGAEEVMRLANRFMADDFAPTLREFAGERVDNMLRSRATGSEEVTQQLLRTDAQAGESAAQLNRLLMGTRLDPADVRTVMDRFNAGEAVGVGNFQTRTVEEYQQSIRDVTEVMLARLGSQTNFTPTPRAVERFLNRYDSALESFPPEVRNALSDIRQRTETLEGRRDVMRALQSAQSRLEPYRFNIDRITPETALNRIQSIQSTLRDTNLDPDQAVAAARNFARAQSREQAVQEAAFVRLFNARDPKDAIAAVFRQQDPRMTLRETISQIGDTPENMAMLRQATANYLRENVARVPRGDNSPETIRQVLGKLNSFLSNSTNRAALSEIYGPDGLRAMEIIQDQIRNSGALSMSINSGALSGGVERDLRRQFQETSVELAGAGALGPRSGISGRARQRSIIQLINRAQGLVSGTNIDQVIAARMTDIALDPRAALAVLEPMSETRASLLAVTLINDGRAAMIALREYLGEEAQEEPEAENEAMPEGFMRSGGRSL